MRSRPLRTCVLLSFLLTRLWHWDTGRGLQGDGHCLGHEGHSRRRGPSANVGCHSHASELHLVHQVPFLTNLGSYYWNCVSAWNCPSSLIL